MKRTAPAATSSSQKSRRSHCHGSDGLGADPITYIVGSVKVIAITTAPGGDTKDATCPSYARANEGIYHAKAPSRLHAHRANDRHRHYRNSRGYFDPELPARACGV